MARADAAVEAVPGGGGWLLHLPGASPLPLRTRPPPAEDAVVVKELLLPAVDDSYGVDGEGRLVPLPEVAIEAPAGPGDEEPRRQGGEQLPLPPQQPEQQQQQPDEAPASTAAAAAAADGTVVQPPNEEAMAAAAAAPARKRPRAVDELEPLRSSSPGGSGMQLDGRGDLMDADGGGMEADGSGSGTTSLFGSEEEEEDGEEEQEGTEEGDRKKGTFDTQCALCDDGGDLMACDGPCLRSFHTDAEGCNLLDLPADLAAHLVGSNETFRCPNCLAGVQQCFKCKRDGKENADVFKCIHASCGRHYHLKCAGVEPGQEFACPLHTCATCKQPAEGGGDKGGELVPCRRCPRAWHRRCLPSKLPRNRERPEGARMWLADFDEEQGKWLDGVEQSLVYCTRHKLDPDTGQALFERNVVPKGGGKEVQAKPYQLIRPALRRPFLLHYAQQCRHLESSRQLLAQEAAREQHEALRTRSAQGAGDESESEEDVPLAEKRRRLGKAVVGDDSEEDEPLAVKRQRLEKAAKARQPGKERPKLAAAAPPSTAAAAAAAGAEAEVQPSGSAADAARVGRAEGGKEAQRAAAAAAAPPSAPGSTDELDAQRLRAMLGRLVPVPNSLARQERRRRLLREAEDDPRYTKDSLWNATRRPEPYNTAMKKTIDENKLQSLERAVRYALQGLAERRIGERELAQILDAQAVMAILRHYDDLLLVLAPYLHKDRYSSYGRHFTAPKLLHAVAERVALFLRSGDQVVDFSCGDNYFMPHLKRLCLKSGVAVRGRAYDIILARDATDFVLKSWLDASPATEGLAPGNKLCICLNPPFGKANSLADKFVARAAAFKPRLIALIVPPQTIIPPNYQVVYENRHMCGGEEFYVPGSSHRSWNKEWPVLRILARQEERPDRVHGEYEVLADCTAAVQARAGGLQASHLRQQEHQQSPRDYQQHWR